MPESFLNKVAGGGACNFIKKEALAQVLSCEFCEISKNTFFTERLWWLLLSLDIFCSSYFYIYFTTFHGHLLWCFSFYFAY